MSEDDDRSESEAEELSGEASSAALGRAIRVWRAARDWNRRELAAAADVSYSYLSEIETGKKQPSSRTILRLARALDVSASELISTAEELQRESEGAAGPEPEDVRNTMAEAEPDWEEAPTSGPPTRRESQDSLGRPRGARARQRSWFQRPRSDALAFRDERAEPDADLEPTLKEFRFLLGNLSPEDRERVIDLVRRLAR